MSRLQENIDKLKKEENEEESEEKVFVIILYFQPLIVCSWSNYAKVLEGIFCAVSPSYKLENVLKYRTLQCP